VYGWELYCRYSIRLITTRVPLERVIIDTCIFVFRKRHHGDPVKSCPPAWSILFFLSYNIGEFCYLRCLRRSSFFQHLHKLFPSISLLPTIVSYYYRYINISCVCVGYLTIYFVHFLMLFRIPIYYSIFLFFAIFHIILYLVITYISCHVHFS